MFLWVLLGGLNAQNRISIAGFYLNETDLTANTYGTEKRDINGEKCALLKIETTQTDFTFDCGSIAPTSIEYKVGEIWVYVSRGVRRITVKHPHLGVLRDYEFPVPIESAKTYIMQLSMGEVTTLVKERLPKGYLIFKVNPPDATLYVNEEVVLLENGQAALFKDFGVHVYRVEHALYQAVAGKVSLTQDEAEVSVEMKPDFGYLNISASSSAMQGASVFVNGRLAGTIPYHSAKMKSGSCKVIVKQDLYEQYTHAVTIPSDGTVVTLNPVLTPRFAPVQLLVADNAEIWIDGKRRGVGSRQENLEYGDHLVECKAANHRSTSKKISIASPLKKTFELEPPIPITGNLNVSSKPLEAKIFLDGKEMGVTPKLLRNILIGKHEVGLVHDGYKKKTVVVEIEEGGLETVNAMLDEAPKSGALYVFSTPSARIFVDGEYIGFSPKRMDSIAIGKHEVNLVYDGYAETKTVEVEIKSNELFIVDDILEMVSDRKTSDESVVDEISEMIPNRKTRQKRNYTGNSSKMENYAETWKSDMGQMRHMGGPINALLSLAVPGLGVHKVSDKTGIGTAMITYSFLGAGIGAKVYSNKEYKKYHAATTQSDMDNHYEIANLANYLFYGCMVAGGLIWIADIIRVAVIGAQNVKCRRSYLGYYYNPEVDAMGLSYTIKF